MIVIATSNHIACDRRCCPSNAFSDHPQAVHCSYREQYWPTRALPIGSCLCSIHSNERAGIPHNDRPAPGTPVPSRRPGAYPCHGHPTIQDGADPRARAAPAGRFVGYTAYYTSSSWNMFTHRSAQTCAEPAARRPSPRDSWAGQTDLRQPAGPDVADRGASPPKSASDPQPTAYNPHSACSPPS